MKNYLVLFLLFSFTCSMSQELETVLHFRDGTSFEGYGYIDKNNNIKFRFEDEEEYETWTDLLVKEVDFYFYRGSETYRYVDLNGKIKYSLVRVIVDGEYSLYGTLKRSYIASGSSFQFDGQVVSTRKYEGQTIDKYYLKKSDQLDYTLITKFSMRRKMRSIFNDCEDFTSRYDDGEFKSNTLQEIVEYYNDYCID